MKGMTAKDKILVSFFKFTAIAAALPFLVAIGCSASLAQDPPKQLSLTVLNYVTGWIHDTVGYHPAVFMMVENTSGRDLSNVPIKLQARFTDLQTAEVSIGRKEARKDCKQGQRMPLSVVGTEAFELPFEIDQWPHLETKVMCRLGDAGDEGTETLMIAKVEPVTHTEEDAFQSLNQDTSYSPRHRPPAPPVIAHTTPRSRWRDPQPAAVPDKPLVATAGHVDSSSQPSAPARTTVHSEESTAMGLLSAKGVPGLGDDFYQFEQRFGLPQEFDAKHGDWTWAHYRHGGSGVELIGGAQQRKGNVDVLIVKVPKAAGVDEYSLSNVARNLAGKLRAEPLSAASKSVRYLPSGRLQLLTRSAPGYRVLCLTPSDESDNCFILVLSRTPQDIEQLLAAQTQKVALLRFVRFLDGRKDGDHP
jgi:hypothetical protein